jgi:hypothetical protein
MPGWSRKERRTAREGKLGERIRVEAAEATPIVARARNVSSTIEHGRAAVTLRRASWKQECGYFFFAAAAAGFAALAAGFAAAALFSICVAIIV